MKYFFRTALLILFLIGLSISLFSQNNFFSDAGANALFPATAKRDIVPEKYRASLLNIDPLKNFLLSLPAESTITDRKKTPVLEIPAPDGTVTRFHVWESPVMAPELASRFPEIKTFLGQGIDDPYATIRFDYNPYFGFHAEVLTVNGGFYIDPYAKWDVSHYISYYIHDNKRIDPIHCEVTEILNGPQQPEAGPCRGTQLFVYRLALACTGEYAIAVCAPNPATVPVTMAAMVTSVNRVTGVYEVELAIRMVMIANDNLLVYLDPATDPYTNNSGGIMLGQNQTNIDNIIGDANYDIGHVFSTGGGGIAGLGVVCRSGQKARGVTGSSNPVGDNFDIDYVAHEMGHQFGGNHSFNSVTGSCNGNRNGSTAYEVGSATSIMGYAGICGTDDIQPHSDPAFHTISFDEISNYLVNSGGNCPTRNNTNNTLPVITSMNNNGANIPVNTPFTLTGTATDADNDPLTYCWEEWDLGPAGAWNSGANSTTAPLFKSRLPKTTGSRTFPDIAVILAGYPANPPAVMGGLKGETLPQLARTMKFRLTVRDNRAGGGGVVTGGEGCQISTTFQINTIAGTGPFLVTSPNGGETLISGLAQTITWDVAGTNATPVNAANVKISLSTDGGLTYPTVLLASAPNNGSASVVLPCLTTTTARIKVEAIGNIFFDISDANFSIQSGFDFDSPAAVSSPCPVPASMSLTLNALASCGFSNPVTLSAGTLPNGTTISFGTNPVTPGSSSLITLNGTNTLAPGSYTITITGIAAGSPTRTRNVNFIINTTAPPVITSQPGDQTICSGASATFCVTATGTNIYQWEYSPNCNAPWLNIVGGNTQCLTVTTISSMSYRCVIMGACGTVVYSNCATVTVINPVIITSQPANAEICAGSNAGFSVTGNSSQPINYQWQVNTGSGFTNIVNGGVYSNATTATLNITAAPASMNGFQYRCLLSSAACTSPATSTVATLTVHQLPGVVLIASPMNSLLPGQTTTLTANPNGSGGVLSLTWLYNTTAISNPGNTRVVNVEQTGNYRVKVQEAWPNGLVCMDSSQVVTITATASNKLFIFPNPNDGHFTVSYYNNGGANSFRTITIYDSKGGRVYNAKFAIAGSYTLINVNIAARLTGIYYVVVGDSTGKKLISGKVLAQ